MDRRQFLKSASSGVLAAALPVPVLAAAAPALDVTAAAPLQAFVVGTPGEFDWMHVAANNAQDAIKMWLDDRGYDDEEYGFALSVQRVPAWDGRNTDSVNPADWIRANLGHCCSRCGYECHPETGAQAIGDEVVCEECLTLPDQLEGNPEDVVDDLANRIACDGEAETREWLEAKGWWDRIPQNLWNRAVAAVEEDA
ncbi:MAG: hypothetical protein E5W09_22940 [Mesorhizobium sp.]|nr:MAG: hypothetical protein E5W09_22940 [Mesorhizobium sp.]